MKSLLIKFYRSLAIRVAFALAASASAANAHDLPSHFPLAPTDWGMMQQDCLGFRESAIAPDLVTKPEVNEIVINRPDVGNPPEPQSANTDTIASQDLIGPSLYDGVDCAQLESFYRANKTAELVEYRSASVTQFAAAKKPSAEAKFEFSESSLVACNCDFENRQANQSILPPKFIVKRTFIEDYFADYRGNQQPLVVRNFGFPRFDVNSNPSYTEPLARAVPTVRNKHLLGSALSQVAAWDCVARSEFASSQMAFELGELTCSVAKSWFSGALPNVSQSIVTFAEKLKPTQDLYTSTPKFIIFQTKSGNEVAVPISQARNWKQPASESPSLVVISKEFQEILDSANTRLQWAGGRMSAAASYMNDWLSDRMARSKADELR